MTAGTAGRRLLPSSLSNFCASILMTSLALRACIGSDSCAVRFCSARWRRESRDLDFAGGADRPHHDVRYRWHPVRGLRAAGHSYRCADAPGLTRGFSGSGTGRGSLAVSSTPRLKDFLVHPKTLDAVIRNLEVLDEASSHVKRLAPRSPPVRGLVRGSSSR